MAVGRTRVAWQIAPRWLRQKHLLQQIIATRKKLPRNSSVDLGGETQIMAFKEVMLVSEDAAQSVGHLPAFRKPWVLATAHKLGMVE